MISERVTLLKPLGRQHPPLILPNPQNNELLHAGDCDRFYHPAQRDQSAFTLPTQQHNDRALLLHAIERQPYM